MKTSKYSGFYKLSVTDRLNEVADFAALTEGEKEMLRRDGALSLKEADRMIENAIGIMPIPLGVAVNFASMEKTI